MKSLPFKLHIITDSNPTNQKLTKFIHPTVTIPLRETQKYPGM